MRQASHSRSEETGREGVAQRVLAWSLLVVGCIGLVISWVGFQWQGDPDSGGVARHSLVGVGIPFLVGSAAILLLSGKWLSRAGNGGLLTGAACIAFALAVELAVYLAVAPD